MIQNIEAGSGFRGLVKYLFSEGKDAIVLAGTLSGTNPDALAADVAAIRKLNQRANKVISHISLSLPPGERLSDEQWAEVAQKYIYRMGYDNCAWTAVRHHDTEHDHIHLGVVRIDMATGKVVKNSWDYRRGEAIVRELEKEYGLSAPKEHATSRRMNRNEVNAILRTETLSHRQQIAEAIDAALETPCTLPEFIDRLATVGVGVQVNMASTGRISGISFDLGGGHHVFKGSKIGKSYTWGNLQKRGVDYEKDRDSAKVIARQNNRGEENSQDSDRGARAGQRIGANNSAGLEHDNEANASRDKKAESSTREVFEHDRRNRTHRRNSEQTRATKPHDEADSVEHLLRDADSWSDAVSSVAVVVTDNSSCSSDGVQRIAQLTPATQAKVLAWDKQHEALRAQAYRITLTSRRDNLRTFNLGKGRGEAGYEKFYNADEVRELIPYLSAQNIKGYDIYITPIDPAHHFLVLDDSTAEKINEAKRKYGEPCLVQESSPENLQAIFKVERDADFKHEQQLANKVVQQINKEFGDPNFSGVVHPFRMAGFSNKKPGKNNFFTRIKSAFHSISRQLSALLCRMREAERTQEQKQEQERTVQRLRAMSASVDCNDSWGTEKCRQIGLAENNVRKGIWHSVDASAVDFRTVKALIESGYDAQAVCEMMMRDSEIALRHTNTEDYIVRTVQKAAAEVLRQAQRSRGGGPDLSM